MKMREEVLDLPVEWFLQDATSLRKQLGIVDQAPPALSLEPTRTRPRKAVVPPKVTRLAEVPLLLTYRETCVRLRICTTKLYELLNEKVFVPVRVAGKRLIPESQIVDYLMEKINEANQKRIS